MTDKIKVVPSQLYTTASDKVEEEIEEELKIVDPPENEAMATLAEQAP